VSGGWHGEATRGTVTLLLGEGSGRLLAMAQCSGLGQRGSGDENGSAEQRCQDGGNRHDRRPLYLTEQC
jgi:hypothetical protein